MENTTLLLKYTPVHERPKVRKSSVSKKRSERQEIIEKVYPFLQSTGFNIDMRVLDSTGRVAISNLQGDHLNFLVLTPKVAREAFQRMLDILDARGL